MLCLCDPPQLLQKRLERAEADKAAAYALLKQAGIPPPTVSAGPATPKDGPTPKGFLPVSVCVCVSVCARVCVRVPVCRQLTLRMHRIRVRVLLFTFHFT